MPRIPFVRLGNMGHDRTERLFLKNVAYALRLVDECGAPDPP